MTIDDSDITAVILAGGQGRRMGGQDKGLIEFNGVPLIKILIEQLQRQSVKILINANRNQDIYRQYQLPVVSDELDDFQGPLAGFATSMAAVDTTFILTLPCDGPVLALDYAEKFRRIQQVTGASICVAHDGERLQPVHAMVKTQLLSSLHQFLESGERKIDRWYQQHDFVTVDFAEDRNMFRNINTPADQQAIQADS